MSKESRSPAQQKRIENLSRARKQVSVNKEQSVKATVSKLVESGATITFASVAREAKVSIWFLYNKPGLADLIRSAMLEQKTTLNPTTLSSNPSLSAETLQVELLIAKERVAGLQAQNKELSHKLQLALGATLVFEGNEELSQNLQTAEGRINELLGDLDRERRSSLKTQEQLRDAQETIFALRASLKEMMANRV